MLATGRFDSGPGYWKLIGFVDLTHDCYLRIIGLFMAHYVYVVSTLLKRFSVILTNFVYYMLYMYIK